MFEHSWSPELAFGRDAGICDVQQRKYPHPVVLTGLRQVLCAGLYALLALPLESSFAGGRVLGKGLSPPPAARGGRGPAAETRVQVLLMWRGLLTCMWQMLHLSACASSHDDEHWNALATVCKLTRHDASRQTKSCMVSHHPASFDAATKWPQK